MASETCPRESDHTPAPQSYVGRQDWARAMAQQRSVQRRCPGCGLWVVWNGVKPPISPGLYERGCIAVQFGKR